jgi:peptidoglycan hydrolase CwlO-like protein
MNQSLLTNGLHFVGPPDKMDMLHLSIEAIKQKLDADVTSRQKTIDLQEQEIHRLHKLIEDKNSQLLQLNEKVAECTRNNEGNRQLINKLLGDISHLNQDIEWYKRTYEKRSLLGTIKEKMSKKR